MQHVNYPPKNENNFWMKNEIDKSKKKQTKNTQKKNAASKLLFYWRLRILFRDLYIVRL